MSEDVDAGPAKWLPRAMVELVTTGESRRARRALGSYAAAIALYELVAAWRKKIADQGTYLVAVPASDDLYNELHRWLLEQSAGAEHRSLIVRSAANEIVAAGEQPSVDLKVALTTGQSAVVFIAGHEIKAEVEEPAHAVFSSEAMPWERQTRERIAFRATSRAGRDAVLAWLADRAADLRDRGPRLSLVEPWGDLRSSPLLPRSFDTVALPADQKKRIIADLEWFLGAEAEHTKLGLPWHRGYLFHGPPGTGKTTAARALATHFGLDMVYLPLASLHSDVSLMRILIGCPPRSLLLLEDVDVVHASHDREGDEGGAKANDGLTLQGLLNGLDGVATPHGLITIATTNDPSKLDPALVRAGRLDVKEEFGELDWPTLGTLVEILDAGPIPDQLWATGRGFKPEGATGTRPRLPHLTAADLIEAAKPHLGNGREQRTAAIIACLEDAR